MICFDRMKLSIPKEYIINVDYDKFRDLSEKENIIYHKYEIKSPYKLTIIIRPNELVIEFSSKILLDKYIDLINKNNIHDCFYNINKLGLINLDIDKILIDSKVLSCDITKDFKASLADIKQYIILNTIDRLNWTLTTPKKTNNIILENNVMTKCYKKRITFYDKNKEILSAPNKEFLNLLQDQQKVLDYFSENNVRIECNIKTEKQIRNMLNIKENQLLDVLNTEENPLQTILNEAVRNVNDIDFNSTNNITGLKENEKLAIIEKCGYDMLAVEQFIKTIIPPTTPLARTLEPYYKVFDKLKRNDMPKIDLHKLVYQEK